MEPENNGMPIIGMTMIWATRNGAILNSVPRAAGCPAETKELLELRLTDTNECDEVTARTRRKIARVDARIRDLRRIRRSLQQLVRACDENEQAGECPILDALDHELDEETTA